MEAQRLAIIATHLRPITTSTYSSPAISASQSSSSPSPSSHSVDSDASADCVFCRIVQRQSHAFVLYEDDVCLCILDLKIHCVLGKTLAYHSKISFLFTGNNTSIYCSSNVFKDTLFKQCDSYCDEFCFTYLPDAFNLLVNNGAAAGQVIFHTHIHIIPRKETDCLWASKSMKRHNTSTGR